MLVTACLAVKIKYIAKSLKGHVNKQIFRTCETILTLPRVTLAYPKTWSLNEGFSAGTSTTFVSGPPATRSVCTSEPSPGIVEADERSVNLYINNICSDAYPAEEPLPLS